MCTKFYSPAIHFIAFRIEKFREGKLSHYRHRQKKVVCDLEVRDLLLINSTPPFTSEQSLLRVQKQRRRQLVWYRQDFRRRYWVLPSRRGSFDRSRGLIRMDLRVFEDSDGIGIAKKMRVKYHQSWSHLDSSLRLVLNIGEGKHIHVIKNQGSP